VFRARNKLFNDLLEHNDAVIVAAGNGRQAAYLDRVINRTEIATRVSHMTPAYVSKVASKWFWDKETAVTGYGNLHSAMANSHYNRTFKRATLGNYSMAMVHIQY
jgi:mitochondrial-processing peptidase subunit beta